ncbi:hypothetical protein D3C75_855870 [compost metagenome]
MSNAMAILGSFNKASCLPIGTGSSPSDFGIRKYIPTMASSPSTPRPAKINFQSYKEAATLPSGTPTTSAVEKPITTVAIPLPCLSGGASLDATINAVTINTPVLSARTILEMNRRRNPGKTAVMALPMTNATRE